MKKQNLNIGDELLCKKDYKSYSRFIKGRYYIVGNFSIYHHEEYYYVNYSFFDEYGYDDYIYYIIDESNNFFSVVGEKDLYAYFYTKKEERNIKLTKLNEKTEY